MKINKNLVEIYKNNLMESISREMMEPTVEPEPGPPKLDDFGKGLGRFGRDVADRLRRVINYERIPALGLDSWLRDLYLRGLLSMDDLRNLYRDSNGNYYIKDNGLLRRIIEDPTNPNGWSYDPNSTPIAPLNKKPWGKGELQQYYPNQVGPGGWGGWGRTEDPMWQYGVGGGVALPLMLQDPNQSFPDSDGDGIPDYIDAFG